MKWDKIHIGWLTVFLISACAQDPKQIEQADIHFRVARQLLAKNETTQAMAEAVRAEKLDSQNAEIQNFLGLLYVQRRELDKAEKYFRRSIKLDPKYSEAQNHLCALYIERENYDQAIAHCTKAVENVMYGTPERAYHNMGIAYQRKGNTKQAIEAYRKGLIHNRNFVMSLKSLGKLYFNQGNYKKAVRTLGRAAKVCKASPKGSWLTECPESHYQLAIAFVKLQKRKQAMAAFQDCINSSWGSEERYGKKCRARLKLYR